VSDFTEVINIDPKNALAYYNRASALSSLTKNDKACEDMRQSAKLGYADAFNHIRQLCSDLSASVD